MASTQVAQVGGRRLREARASSQDSAEKEKSLPTVAVQQASILCWEGTDTELSQSRVVD